MSNRLYAIIGLTNLLLASCAAENGGTNGDGASTSGFDSGMDTNRSGGEAGALDVSQSDQDGGLDSGLACCPTGYSLYQCQRSDGTSGFACHNPAMGCASSSTCGAGCDPQVSGRCQCVQTEACIVGDHFDPNLCKCVPNLDAGTAIDACVETVLCIRGDHFDRASCTCVPDRDAGAVDAACIDNVLCISGTHFDSSLCRCVPNADSGIDSGRDSGADARCIDTILCVAGTHFDSTACKCLPNASGCSTAADCTGALPALCQKCADGSDGCAHFSCVAGKCTVAYCP